jgi:hypothetical protein
MPTHRFSQGSALLLALMLVTFHGPHAHDVARPAVLSPEDGKRFTQLISNLKPNMRINPCAIKGIQKSTPSYVLKLTSNALFLREKCFAAW